MERERERKRDIRLTFAQELFCPSQGVGDPVADEWERRALCLCLAFNETAQYNQTHIILTYV